MDIFFSFNMTHKAMVAECWIPEEDFGTIQVNLGGGIGRKIFMMFFKQANNYPPASEVRGKFRIGLAVFSGVASVL